MTQSRDIALVGCGNVASHLAHALAPRLMAIVSRNAGHARELALEVNPEGEVASGTPDLLHPIKPKVIIVSVADKALPTLAASIGKLDGNPLVVHTSGTISKDVLNPMSARTGVFYPLQTFSRGEEVDMRRVPFFTETSEEDDLAIIDSIARSISDNVQHADEAKRRRLHIAGVFASNFPNILYEITGEILAGAGYSLDTVRPLVEAMTAKAFTMGPHDAQTGPARRGDTEVIQSHIRQLPETQAEIYSILSQYIMDAHNEQTITNHE